jgi:hypothetical protein
MDRLGGTKYNKVKSGILNKYEENHSKKVL